MKILFINPNTTKGMTQAIERTARANAAPDTQITCVNPEVGPKAIETAYDIAIASFYVLDLIKKNEKNFDGFIIACGADPGIVAAREIIRKPIAGIGESGLMTASSLANKFSILCPCVPGGAAVAWEAVRALGLEKKCASVKITGEKGVLGCFALSQDEMVEMLCRLGKEAVEKDGARALMLLCAGMTGTREILENRLKVPVVDGVITALKTLEQFPPRG
jgi:allantoin racemase